MEAAVMPLPSEEVTPPVTKTYFGIARLLCLVAQARLLEGTREHGRQRHTREVSLAHRGQPAVRTDAR